MIGSNNDLEIFQALSFNELLMTDNYLNLTKSDDFVRFVMTPINLITNVMKSCY